MLVRHALRNAMVPLVTVIALSYAGLLEGSVLDAAGVRAIAILPPREVLLGRVVGTIAAPISGLLTVLQGNISGLARALQQIADQKEAA